MIGDRKSIILAFLDPAGFVRGFYAVNAFAVYSARSVQYDYFRVLDYTIDHELLKIVTEGVIFITRHGGRRVLQGVSHSARKKGHLFKFGVLTSVLVIITLLKYHNPALKIDTLQNHLNFSHGSNYIARFSNGNVI